MAVRGVVSHLDLNVVDVETSIAFYDLLLPALGFERMEVEAGRAWWSIDYGNGCLFGLEIRLPAQRAPHARHERYSPGIDHLAFHAASRAEVDAVYELLTSAGVDVADPPAEYDYVPGYYAVAFDDPSGIRLEVVHDPSTNPA